MIYYLIPFFLCWGSLLNVVAYRLIVDTPFFAIRLYCPACKQALSWYGMISIISWLPLKKKPNVCVCIRSSLYSFIEGLTALTFLCLLLLVPSQWQPTYLVFFSSLIVTIRTDFEFMLISRFVSLFLIPLSFVASYFHLLPLSITESICAAIIGYGSFYVCNLLFFSMTKKNGIGEGDMELMAFIGSVIGIVGWWVTLLIGSFIGSITGILYVWYTKKSTSVRLPFGPFLSFGAILYVLFSSFFTTWLMQ